MPKEILVILTIIVLPLTFFVYLIAVNVVEFKKECRSHGGIPIVGKYESVCYAPGTVIDVG